MKPVPRQRGAGTIEFAMVAVLFLTLVLAIVDFGRMLFTWNAAAEATRLGARVAVVCDKGSSALVLARMQAFLPQLAAANVVITWYNPDGTADPNCDSSNCKAVQVAIYNNAANPDDPSNLKLQAISPFMGFVMPPVPAFPSYLPRESMQSASSAGDPNPVCL
ncbi:MAG: TadE/TadG family type IV pilus assembly protein [Ignavibacteria bacterium]